MSDKKPYGYADIGTEIRLPKDIWNDEPIDHLYDYQKKIMTDIQDIRNYNTIVKSFTPPPSRFTYSDMQKLWEEENHFYKNLAKVKQYNKGVQVTMDDGTEEVISREDLIKYISERKLVQGNEVVRKVYERYQVAVKLVGSDDNGDTGV